MDTTPLRKWRPVRFALEMLDIYFEKHVARSAAELAYFMTLTVFPILICLNAFLGWLQLDLGVLLGQAEVFLPSGVTAVLEDYLGYLSAAWSPGLLAAGVVTAVFFAASALRGLMNLMEDLYGITTFRGVKRLAASLIISVLMLVTIYLSVAVVVTGNWFFHLVEQLLRLDNVLPHFTAWQWIKYPILLAMIFLLLLLLYRACAPLDKPRPPVIIGALLASVALAAFSSLFSYFIGLSARYSLVYGSLASIMILLVWLYFCGTIVIMGNVFNYVWYTHQKEGRGEAQ